MKPKDKRASSKPRRKVTQEKDKTKLKMVLAKRPYGYLVGIAILPAATLGFLLGFVSPYWHFRSTGPGNVTMVHGLWLVCEQDPGSLTLIRCEQTIIRAEDWLRGMQFLEVMGLFFLLLACLFAVLLNCTRKDVHSRLLEIFAGAGALFAIFGSFGYLFLTLSPRDAADELTYNWAFGINITGSVLAVIAAILFATNNPAPPMLKSPKEQRTAQWVNGHQEGGKSLQLFSHPPPKMIAIQREVVPVPPPPTRWEAVPVRREVVPVTPPPTRWEAVPIRRKVVPIPPMAPIQWETVQNRPTSSMAPIKREVTVVPVRAPPPPPPPVLRLSDPRRHDAFRSGQNYGQPVLVLPVHNYM